MSSFDCLFSTEFVYLDPEEVRYIVERSLTAVVKHAHLTPFAYLNELVVSNDVNNKKLLVTELELHSDASYSQHREAKDLQRLASHYRALRIEAMRKQQILANNLQCACARQQQNAAFGAVWSDVENCQLRLQEFIKEHQFFLMFNMRFISLSRASYDRDGRVCLLRFAIETF